MNTTVANVHLTHHGHMKRCKAAWYCSKECQTGKQVTKLIALSQQRKLMLEILLLDTVVQKTKLIVRLRELAIFSVYVDMAKRVNFHLNH